MMISGPRRIFVSYSHIDRAYLDEFLAILRPRLRDDLIEVWDDSDLRAGDDFHRRLEEECAISDGVVLLVSENFLKSRYCQDVEMVWTARRANALDLPLVPVILERCDWKATVLRHFQASPGKPIKEFADRSEGYLAAADDVRQSLESDHRYQWMGPAGAAFLLSGSSQAGGAEFNPEHTAVADIGGAIARVGQEIASFMSSLEHAAEHDHHADENHESGDHHTDDSDQHADHGDDHYDWDDHHEDDGR